MNIPDTTRHMSIVSPPRWSRRIACAGFAFFLAKGLIWLAVPCIVYLAH